MPLVLPPRLPAARRALADAQPSWSLQCVTWQRRRRCAAATSAAAAAEEACHYRTLGVPPSATRADVKMAFRRLARLWHPDVNSAPSATEQFKAISRAFKVLSDDRQRRQYDDARSTSSGGSSSGSGSRAPGSGSGGTAGGPSSSDEAVPDDVPALLHLDFREALLGAQCSLMLDLLGECRQCAGSGAQPGSHAPLCRMCRGRREIVKRLQQLGGAPAAARDSVVCCPACSGRGRDASTVPCTCCSGAGLARRPTQVAVRVPAGAEDGSRLRLEGQGDQLRVGGRRGAVALQLSVGLAADGTCRRGLDLHSGVAVPLWDALLGGTAAVGTLRGATSLAIPPGTQHGTVLTLHGAGVAAGQVCGAHHFEVQVQLPREVGSAERALLQRLAALQEVG